MLGRSVTGRVGVTMRGWRIGVVCLAAVGCGDVAPSRDGVGQDQAEIINGVADTTHPAVVAIFGASNSACSGTIIHTDVAAGVGHAITAAHCGQSQYVVLGNDYNAPDAVFTVVSSQNHPSYDGDSYDFKMVRFQSASSATPVIPAATPPDNLAVGTAVIHVGYGKAGPAPGSPNSIRRSINGNLSDVNSVTVEYNQPSGGPCSGDSGGPQLSQNGARVVGVTSQGDPSCASYGESGRVAAVHNAFILPFINQPVAPLNCNGCAQAATTGQGACMPEVDACNQNGACSSLLECYQGCNTAQCYQQCDATYPNGVSVYQAIISCICDVGCATQCDSSGLCDDSSMSASAAVGAGATSSSTAAGVGGGMGAGGDMLSGAGGADDGWMAGEASESPHDGEVVSSGACQLGQPGNDGPGSWGPWALAALAWVYAARRRPRSGTLGRAPRRAS